MHDTYKRNVTAREEKQRMFQRGGLICADLVPINGTCAHDVNEDACRSYVEKRYGPDSRFTQLPIEQILQNVGLGDGKELNLSGLMLFGKNPTRWRPAFVVKAIAFPGTDIHDIAYRDSQDIGGTLAEQYRDTLAFIKRNLHWVQAGRGFNTLGELEIPEIVLQELLVNALIHRDYFTSASIRVFIFQDRIEFISPGDLPDNLDIQQVQRGRTNRRNPNLTDHAVHFLPYRGAGSGIPRALRTWPNITLRNDVRGNQFIATVQRPVHLTPIDPAGTKTDPVNDPAGAKTVPVNDPAGTKTDPVTDPAGTKTVPVNDTAATETDPVTDPAVPTTDTVEAKTAQAKVKAAHATDQ